MSISEPMKKQTCSDEDHERYGTPEEWERKYKRSSFDGRLLEIPYGTDLASKSHTWYKAFGEEDRWREWNGEEWIPLKVYDCSCESQEAHDNLGMYEECMEGSTDMTWEEPYTLHDLCVMDEL